VGKHGAQRLMEQQGIRARGKRRFRVTTTDSRHNLPIAPSLLSRNFTPAAPDQRGPVTSPALPPRKAGCFWAK
jgi:hypothetical protein